VLWLTHPLFCCAAVGLRAGGATLSHRPRIRLLRATAPWRQSASATKTCTCPLILSRCAAAGVMLRWGLAAVAALPCWCFASHALQLGRDDRRLRFEAPCAFFADLQARPTWQQSCPDSTPYPIDRPIRQAQSMSQERSLPVITGTCVCTAPWPATLQWGCMELRWQSRPVLLAQLVSVHNIEACGGFQAMQLTSFVIMMPAALISRMATPSLRAQRHRRMLQLLPAS